MNGALRPYLTYSAALHAALVVAILSITQAHSSQPDQVYRIDFVGSTGQIQNREREKGDAAQARAALKVPPARSRKPPPQKEPDAFNLRRPRTPLPRPSLLEDYDLNKADEKAAAPQPAQAPAREQAPLPAAAKPSQGEAPGGTPGGAGAGPTVSPDMPNFPYPWYLTSLRSALWDQWASRMRQLSGECEVVFTILRDGSVVDLNIETSSGDAGFDYAAVSSVRAAAPFAPLPRGFEETFLKVHVQFKSQ